MQAKIFNTEKYKALKSDRYNFLFDKELKFFKRWSLSTSDIPSFDPFGPEILCVECVKDGGFYSTHNIYSDFFSFDINQCQNILSLFEKSSLCCIKFDIVGIKYGIENLVQLIKQIKNWGILVEINCDINDLENEEIYYIFDNVDVINVLMSGTFKKLIFKRKVNCKINICFKLNSYSFNNLKKIQNGIVNSYIFLYDNKNSNKYMSLIIDYCLKNNLTFEVDSYLINDLYEYFLLHAKDKISWFLSYFDEYDGGLYSSYLTIDGKLYPCSKCVGHKDYNKYGEIVDTSLGLQMIWNSPLQIEWKKNLLKNKKTILSKLCLTK